MLARLGLNGFVGGDHKDNQIDTADPCEHVAHEFFVAGDVNEPEPHIPQIEKCESEIDRDTAALFFFEAVGIRAGERFHERGFAVVDVAGGADDNVLGSFHQQDSM